MKACVFKKLSLYSFNVMTSKKKSLSIKFYLSALILFTALVSQQVHSQNLIVQTGGTCVGGAVYLLPVGSVCGTTTWTITAPAGSYTPGTQTTNSITITWNTAVTGATIKATYSLQPSCTSQSSAPLTVNIAGSPATPAAPVGTLTRCQGNGTSQFTSTGGNSWSIANAGSSTISGSGSTGTVTWDPNFSGTATVSVRASGACATSAAASVSVTVTPKFNFPVQISGPTPVCGNTAKVTVIVNNNQADSRLGTITYQWYAGGNTVPGTSEQGVPLVNYITTNVTQGMQIYCVVTSSAGLCINAITSSTYTVNITQPTPPSIGMTISPTNLTMCQGTSVTFTATGGLSNYQWSMNGAGAGTGNAFTTTAASATQLQSVSVTATSTGGGGCVSSGTVTAYATNIPFVVIPSATPTISISSDDISEPVCVGTPLSFGANVANGGSTPSLQWRVDGTNIASATGNFFTTTTVYTGQQIDCILTSNAVCATATTATSNALGVTTLPSVGTPAILGPVSTMQRGTSNYSASAVNAQSYNWSISPMTAGNIDANGTVTWSNENPLSAATITVTANGCNGPSVASLQVTLLAPLSGGVILSGNVTITPGSNPGRIVAGSAAGGSCSGNYQYQWQQSSSSSGPFTDIAGSAGNTYLPGAISTTRYFQRKVTCGSDIAFSNIVAVTTGPLSTNQNYVRTRTITRSGINDFTTSGQLTDPHDVQQTTSYFDGLGQPVQTVVKQASPLANDIVSMHVYDPFQRESVTLMGYTDVVGDGNFKGNAANDQYNFNLTQFPVEQYYYSQTDFEASPLNRPLGTYAQGNSWVGSGRGVLAQYLFNTITDNVRIWNIDIPGGSLPVSAGTYEAGQLYKNVSIDEHGFQTIEFKDKDGHVILKEVQAPGGVWAQTYYVYDDLGQLVVVLPPEAVKILTN